MESLLIPIKLTLLVLSLFLALYGLEVGEGPMVDRYFIAGGILCLLFCLAIKIRNVGISSGLILLVLMGIIFFFT